MPYIDVTPNEAQKRAIFRGIPYTIQEGKEIVKYHPAEDNRREIIQVLDKSHVEVEKREYIIPKYDLMDDYNYVIDYVKNYSDNIIDSIKLSTVFQGTTESLGIKAKVGNLEITYWFSVPNVLSVKNDKVVRYELRDLIKNVIGEVILKDIEEKNENNN